MHSETAIAIPSYLAKHYAWAYAAPRSLRILDRQWVANLLLYGHYAKLRDAAFAEFEGRLSGRSLQISCCYGDLTPRLAARVARAGGSLDIVDVLPIQLENAQRKIGAAPQTHFHAMNAEALGFPDGSFDNVLVFLLLHEMPPESRVRTMAEALRVLKPGGVIVVVDFGAPVHWHPLRYLWLPFLGILEPYAKSLWRDGSNRFLGEQTTGRNWRRHSYFGGLFQMLVGGGSAASGA